MRQSEYGQDLLACLEAAIFEAPQAPYLTASELKQLLPECGDHEFSQLLQTAKRGQEVEHYRGVAGAYSLGGKIRTSRLMFWRPGDPRDPACFDFVHGELRDLFRHLGPSGRVALETLVERGLMVGLGKSELYVAAEVLSNKPYNHLHRVEGGLLAPQAACMNLEPGSFSEMATDPHPMAKFRPDFDRVRVRVRDVIARREDGRPASADPEDVFGELLVKLKPDWLRMWWSQTVREWKLLNPHTNPAAALVLTAALAEGALGALAYNAVTLGLTLKTERLNNDPKNWKFQDLIKVACTGNPALVDDRLRASLADLNQTRQRIHAGRLLSEHPEGPIPDLRPEEVERGRHAMRQLLRGALDLVSKNGLAPDSAQ